MVFVSVVRFHNDSRSRVNIMDVLGVRLLFVMPGYQCRSKTLPRSITPGRRNRKHCDSCCSLLDPLNLRIERGFVALSLVLITPGPLRIFRLVRRSTRISRNIFAVIGPSLRALSTFGH